MRYPDKTWWRAVQMCILGRSCRYVSRETGIPEELIRERWKEEAARLGVWLYSRSERPLPPKAYTSEPRPKRKRKR